MIKSRLDGRGRPVWCHCCQTVIQSMHRHDMVMCKCADERTMVGIDGGSAYTRILFGPESRYEFADLDYWNPQVETGDEVHTEAGVYDEVPEVSEEDDSAKLPPDTA